MLALVLQAYRNYRNSGYPTPWAPTIVGEGFFGLSPPINFLIENLNFILKNSLRFPEFLIIHVPFVTSPWRGKFSRTPSPRPIFHKLQLDIRFYLVNPPLGGWKHKTS